VGGVRPGVVVLVRFPFSDLSSSKLRPALAVAPAGGADWVLCQITSNPYSDPSAVALTRGSFGEGGSLETASFDPGNSSPQASRLWCAR
jgi:mRNA interferase MazF